MINEYKFNSVELKSIKVVTILSMPFCSYHLVRAILSNTILSGHLLNVPLLETEEVCVFTESFVLQTEMWINNFEDK